MPAWPERALVFLVISILRGWMGPDWYAFSVVTCHTFVSSGRGQLGRNRLRQLHIVWCVLLEIGAKYLCYGWNQIVERNWIPNFTSLRSHFTLNFCLDLLSALVFKYPEASSFLFLFLFFSLTTWRKTEVFPRWMVVSTTWKIHYPDKKKNQKMSA